MKRLFNENDVINDKGRKFKRNFRLDIEDLITTCIKEGFSINDLELLSHEALSELVLDCRLLKRLDEI